MNNRYRLNTQENQTYLKTNARAILDFGRKFPSPGGSSYYLSEDGTPWTDRNRETWITSRMVHVYSIGSMMGDPGSAALAEAGIQGLLGELKDEQHGGWYAGLTPDGTPLPGKHCYAHAFVILAATSALLAGINGAQELLEEALCIYDRYFWNEEEGLSCDTWNTEFTVLDDYRGINANMHTVEAFLAVGDVLQEKKYDVRAGRIIDRVLGWARDNQYRIPEHFTSSWEPVPHLNREKPDDPFKPYGATPGHGIEWSRLVVQWALASDLEASEQQEYIQDARRLYARAVQDGWYADGAEGIVYTTDWDGKPVIHDRMHWTLAEAINASAVFHRVTREQAYADDYARFMEYLDTAVLDPSCGSWFHQLDRHNRKKDTVWPGKPDLYHAFQAMLIPYSNPGVSIAKEVYDRQRGPLEIERKFLIRYPDPEELNRLCSRKIHITQDYLASGEGQTRRIRKSETEGKVTYWYTEKEKITDVIRVERERKITQEEYVEFQKELMPGVRTIRKMRYVLPYQERSFEIDIFPEWTDRAYAEIELGDAQEEFTLPDCLTVIKEVTDDHRYTNASLARNGFVYDDI